MHVPAWQTSVWVHALASLHAVPSGRGVEMHVPVGSHDPATHAEPVPHVVPTTRGPHTPLIAAPAALLHARQSEGLSAPGPVRPQVVLQQTPSTQKPAPHWESVVHAMTPAVVAAGCSVAAAGRVRAGEGMARSGAGMARLASGEGGVALVAVDSSGPFVRGADSGSGAQALTAARAIARVKATNEWRRRARDMKRERYRSGWRESAEKAWT